MAGKIIFVKNDEKWLKEQFERLGERYIDGVVPSSFFIQLAQNSKIWRRFEKEIQQDKGSKKNERRLGSLEKRRESPFFLYLSH